MTCNRNLITVVKQIKPFIFFGGSTIRNPDCYLNLTGQNGVPWPTSTAKESREVGIVVGHIAVSNKSDLLIRKKGKVSTGQRSSSDCYILQSHPLKLKVWMQHHPYPPLQDLFPQWLGVCRLVVPPFQASNIQQLGRAEM